MKNGRLILSLSLVTGCLSLGCASFGANPYDYTISGETLSPASVIHASSEARNANITTDFEARERNTRLRMAERCYLDYGPICASIGYGVGYGSGIYMPYDYTNLGLLAVAGGMNGQNGANGSDADVADAKARADLALNKFLKHAVELHEQNKKEE